MDIRQMKEAHRFSPYCSWCEPESPRHRAGLMSRALSRRPVTGRGQLDAESVSALPLPLARVWALTGRYSPIRPAKGGRSSPMCWLSTIGTDSIPEPSGAGFPRSAGSSRGGSFGAGSVGTAAVTVPPILELLVADGGLRPVRLQRWFFVAPVRTTLSTAVRDRAITDHASSGHRLSVSQTPTHPCRQARAYSAAGSRSVIFPLLLRSTIG